jgi:NAD(P)-dependent dehydrogenase (short-subunit alcohol dehydrogenase family)
MTSSAGKWTLDRIGSQGNRRILITGANSGVGYTAAVELARRGATVLLACRDRARGEAALARLRTDSAGPESAAAQAQLILLDLASLTSVRQVAERLRAAGEPIHCLINNAGVMAPPKRLETQDGFELQWGTNVLGHFALTCELMPLLDLGRGSLAGERSRVVTLASIAHKRGKLDFDDIESRHSYVPMRAYAQSKLADLMFAFELERRLRERRLGVVSIAVHPGVARTNLFKVGNGKGLAGGLEKGIAWTIGTFFNSDLDGAIPTLFAATSPEAQGGAYYGSQGLMEARGGDVGPAKIAPRALDQAAQRRLWDLCEQSTGCRF